jgi:cobalt-zinc-cadmium efflux system outer membrane protein
MTVSALPILRAAIALSATLGCCWAYAAETGSEPRPIAGDVPVFRAPAEVPRDPADEQALAPEPTGPLALQEALALALMQSPELAMFSWEVRAGEARALQAGKPPNPELDVRVYRLGIPRRGKNPDEARTRVVFSQVFELGGKARRRHDLAQTERDLAGWDYEAKRIEVATLVAGRFMAVVGAQRRVNALERFVGFLEEMSERVAEFVASGSVRELEVHQVKRQVGLARIELQRAEAELSTARFRLAATWGSQSPRFTEAVGDLDEVKPLPDVDTVIDLARQSPSIARWDAEHARGEAALALAKARRVPDLNAGAGMRWEDDFGDRDYLVDVEIDLPVLDRKQGEIREAHYEMARARAGRSAAEAASSEGIAEFYYLVEESRLRSATLGDEVLPAARATFEAHQVGFEKSAENLDDLLDARRDLARAEVQHTDALVDYHQALAMLESLVGRSLTESP